MGKLNNHPVVVILGIISSVLALFVFITGYDNISTLLGHKGTPTPLAISTDILTVTPVPSQSVVMQIPFSTSFEDLNLSKPSDIFPFEFLARTDKFFNSVSENLYPTTWAIDSRARIGNISLNVIPNGNPSTTSASLGPVNVTNFHTVFLKVWVNSTSNPNIESVNNCESQLTIYYRTDADEWIPRMVICGENKMESKGWWNMSLDFDVSDKSVIQFAFIYNVYNISQPDSTVYFLLDDLEITAK